MYACAERRSRDHGGGGEATRSREGAIDTEAPTCENATTTNVMTTRAQIPLNMPLNGQGQLDSSSSDARAQGRYGLASVLAGGVASPAARKK